MIPRWFDEGIAVVVANEPEFNYAVGPRFGISRSMASGYSAIRGDPVRCADLPDITSDPTYPRKRLAGSPRVTKE